ncbi:MAG: RpiB/LacA/LacB family sugar-phosphate isomerase, partial [Selenomonadaceae bacterium]|nr:RpiB/LacA/LacB family sugar-phosphate isomerase [Selenomonadaceae bacterium]
MKITIGSDHGAVELKEEVKKVLAEFENIEVKDVGTFGTEPVD